MHFKITVSNGHFPLEYRCSSAHEAYGCIEALSTGLLSHIEIDMDKIMETLVDMKSRKKLAINHHHYAIERMEGEI